jgi:glycosyltransferase involved in cell wall biosynthesis
MQITQIHQFSFACSSGDGVTNSLFYIRKLLRNLGFVSEIYSETIPDDLKHEVKDISELKEQPNTLLFSHHCLGYDRWKWLIELRLPKVMVYHNITPVHLLPDAGDIRRWAELGREQLRDWPPYFLGAIGVSELNSGELQQAGYQNIATIPMLVDFEKIQAVTASTQEYAHFSDAYTLLFVGRVCENKAQLELVEALYHLKRMRKMPVRLVLAGAITSGEYRNQIEARLREWDLIDDVQITGKVSEQQLAALYRSADAFVCLSEHEGFGMPLIEAMHYRLPVIARASSNIANTLGGAGLLLEENASARECAAAIACLMQEPALRRHLLNTQEQNLQRFSLSRVQNQLRAYLQKIGVDLVAPALDETVELARERWQIEGPFDSSYSLAIVNRELARALAHNQTNLALRSREGAGDFVADAAFLNANPDCKTWDAYAKSARVPAKVALRFCYPPKLDDMNAQVRLVHSYGWEETGFPQSYVNEFNRRLDGVSVLSKVVAKTLRDNGVRVPIYVTGAGVDHLQSSTEPLPPDAQTQIQTQTWKGFRFLHISSCFPRKGVDVLLRAYGAAFKADDDVTLVIKTFPNPHNTVRQQLAQLKTENANYPHVEIIEEDWTQAQIVSLYRSTHAFVAPSRGEGFGLPMAEAMLFDLPVITTAWGGQTDFCDAETAWLCDYDFAKSQTHLGLTHSLWAEPKVAHLSQLMRGMLDLDTEQKNAKIKLAKQRVQQHYTWKASAQHIERMVADLQQQTALRKLSKEPKIGWVTTWNARCGIANYSQYLLDHFPRQRICVLANHVIERTGYDQNFVRRCWLAGDEENLDDVVATILEENLTAVVLQYNFSFFTLKNLERFILRLQEHGIALHVFFHSTADVHLPEQVKSLGTIRDSLALVERIYVHGVDDVNRLKAWGLIENVCYFPHGIAPPLQQIPERESVLQGKKVIASYGFLLPHKGILELIQAFAQLDHVNNDYHLLLLNALYPVSVSSDLAHQARALIAALALQNKVSLCTDFLSETETLQRLSQADLIVFPYQVTQESSSAAVRVGLATGKAVAVTPLGIFDDVAEAVHFLPGVSAAEMAQGISELFKQKVASSTVHATNWFAERHWPALAQRLMNMIDGLANAK